ncbi:hypothetical protein [Paenibacillus protaetiae]|uniref:Uncharacterized protein n=1 Tax=Paenibacillus protaetiae TaxID=2509456 RepID=A0A4P6EUS8_9BACL|nr:hypothetical protein [Paenibacillus protaetiae]QAY66742.1 hypothetical protein ET464_10310 [Paenibacillus protaetiae]
MNILKQNKKARTIGASAILITVMLVSAACSDGSSNNNNAQGSPSAEPTPVVSVEPTATDSGNGISDPEPASPDNGTATNTETSAPATDVGKAPADATPIQAEGTFVGLADTHTVEIDSAQGAQSYQFEDSLSDQVNAIDDDAKVKFEYVEKKTDNVVQLWLTKIEASK